jgi:hypothetical protein
LEISDWNDDIALIYLKRLVTNKTRQELCERFRQEDPHGWRIHRNIQLAPQRNPRIGVFQRGLNAYYYARELARDDFLPDDLDPHLPEIDIPTLASWICSNYSKYKTTPALMEHILLLLKNRCDLRKFISRDTLFKALKKAFQLEVVSADMVDGNISFGSRYSHIEYPLDHLVQLVKDHIWTQLNRIVY